MGTFEDILNMAREGAEKVGQKTSDFVEVTKMKMSLSNIEKEINATYEGLGRLVYDAGKSGEDVTDMVQACIDNIDALQADADDLRDGIYTAKQMRKCAACGAINDRDADFCNKCGAAFPSVEEPAEE